jgi:predicted acyltransferase
MIASTTPQSAPGIPVGPIPVTRVATIDIVRALTMVLMIFVNDLG